MPAKRGPGKRKHPVPPQRTQDLHDVETPTEAANLPPSVYPGYEDKLLWYCDSCAIFHVLASTHAMTPFTKKHGLVMRDVQQDGDCFYSCVIQCLKTDTEITRNEAGWLTVERLRDLVARRVTEEQFEFYRMEAVASPKATHLDFIRPAPPVAEGQDPPVEAAVPRRSKLTTRVTATARNSARLATVEVPKTHPFVSSVEELREYTRREGRQVGMGNCLWADSFAQMVIGEGFRLTILLIDMEREKGCFPFRVMHKFEEVGPEKVAAATAAHSKNFLNVLPLDVGGKRGTRRSSSSGSSSGSNVNATRGSSGISGISRTAAPVASTAVAPIYIVKDRPERFIILKRQGPVGHFQYVERAGDGRAVFLREELPAVVKSLWAL